MVKVVSMDNFSVRVDKSSPITESYRKVAANIEFANVDGNIKTIMMTSSLPNEGKTTTITNLALVMTDINKKIIMMDLDLRKPAVHKHFNLSNKIGLTDLLLNKDGYRKYINNIYPGFDVITTGRLPSNVSELISSKALKDLINQLSFDYDYIFLDTPPIISVSDPIHIASFSDAVILTIAYAETDRALIKKSLDSLRHANANIIGTILNKVPVTKNNKYYYNYNYNY